MGSEGSGRDERLWRRVDALIDCARTNGDLRSHRLEVLAARRLRSAGRVVPADFILQERLAAIAAITTPRVLERVATAYRRPAIVLKGPEVAALYQAPSLRTYGDIDLLFEDPEGAQSALIDAGFEPISDPSLYVGMHHLCPLRAPEMALTVEIHSRPHWLAKHRPPSAKEILDTARPSITGVEGMLSPPPEHHTLLLAVHSWAHEPLRRLRDIIDIALMADRADTDEIQRLARTWGVEGLWRTTAAVVDAIFADGSPPLVLRMWAQNLRTARERTVFESHLQRWLSDFWTFPFPVAARGLPGRMLADLRLDDGEGWRTKLDRTALAARHALHPRSEHELVVSGRLESRHGDEEPQIRQEPDHGANRLYEGRG